MPCEMLIKNHPAFLKRITHKPKRKPCLFQFNQNRQGFLAEIQKGLCSSSPQVIEAVAAWTSKDDAEIEYTFLKGARDLQERRAGGELDGGCHHEIADEKEGHRAVEQAEQDEDPSDRLRQAEERREEMDAELDLPFCAIGLIGILVISRCAAPPYPAALLDTPSV